MYFMDIYYAVDHNLIESDYYGKDIDGKKKLIDKCLKEYAISKILEINSQKENMNYDNLSLNELIEILSNLIPKEKHFDTIRHFTHYILNVAGNLQNFGIIWMVEEKEELIQKPEANFNIEGKWENLITHENTSYLEVFNHVYHIFQNEFMLKNYRQLAKHLIQ